MTAIERLVDEEKVVDASLAGFQIQSSYLSTDQPWIWSMIYERLSDNSNAYVNPHREPSSDERPATRIKPNMPLETTVNIYDDATHARLDKEVIADCPAGWLPI